MRTSRLVLLLSALLVLAACGSSSKKSNAPAATSSTPSTAVVSTKASFLAAANAACRTMNAEIAALGQPPADLPLAAEVVDKTGAIAARTLQKIRSLPSPANDSAVLASIYAKVQLTVDDAAALAVQLRANNKIGADRAESKLAADSDAANAASNAYGLTVCGS